VTAQAGPAIATAHRRSRRCTRRQRAQESDDQSRDVYQQILQSEKMAALGQTVSGVAHELNNPLATIISWAERLGTDARRYRAPRISVIKGG
jgi:C4-dicarboxylate-specific signal transduction histidine kinase